MAARVKRAIESEAGRIEKQRDTALADARAQASIAEGIDVAAPHDDDLLQTSLQEAIRTHATLKEKRATYRATMKSAEDAKVRLAELPPGKSTTEAQADIWAAQAVFDKACVSDDAVQERIEDLEHQLREAQLVKQTTEAKKVAARDALAATDAAMVAANESIALRGQLDAAIEATGSLVETTEDEVDTADKAIQDCRIAVNRGVTIRQAIVAKLVGEQHMAKANGLAADAQRLRDAAKDTMNVLTDSIKTLHECPLHVQLSEDGDPRLALETDRSEHEFFDDLSDGERWAIVVGIAAGSNRLFTLPQAAYGELSPSTRAHIHALAQQYGCYILTAVAEDCPLHGEIYQ
jgi:hypothetical protein